MRLTDISIRNLPHGPQKRYRDETLPGFGVTVGQRRKTFFVIHGPSRKLTTLGHWPHTSLREARREAMAILATPGTKQPAEANFSALRAMFIEDCRARLRDSTTDRYWYALKDLENWPGSPTDPNVLKALKAMSNWCLDRELITRNRYARRKVRFNVRERVLTDDEVARLWHYTHPPYSDLVKLLILTGQRRNQLARFELSWCEGDVVTFPASIMKSNRPHTLPITDTVQPLLQTFTIGGWSKHKLRMDRHTGVSDYVLHDFRRYFSTTMAKLGVPLHVTEQILDHRSTVSGVASVYNRWTFLPEMRSALTQYEQHIQTVTA